MKISEIMTPDPITVDARDPIRVAKQIMGQKKIKHLPVINQDQLVVGILSDRDIKLSQAVSEDKNFHENATVSDVYVRNPYCVSPEVPASEVVLHMHEARIGSALITDQGKLLGIFTTVDVCRVMAELLDRN